jgi:hypothetical protein
LTPLEIGPFVRSDEVLTSLLTSSEPSIRSKARVGILHEDRDSAAIRRLEAEIRRSPRVRALLSQKDRMGRPDTARAVYHYWQGFHWVLASLADLGYPPGDETLERMRDRTLDFWLRPVYFREFEGRTRDEGYGRHGVLRIDGRYRRCASQQGNALYSAIRLGLVDERLERLAERLMHWQWPDGGWNCDRRPSADTSSFCETRLPMMGLAAFGRRRRSSKARAAARAASEVFLRRRLFRRVSDGRVIHPEFLTLHYPWYWYYDVLGGLRAMAEVGRLRDPRCAEALDWLESRRLPDGGWPAEKKFYSKRSAEWAHRADYVDWGATSARRANPWVTVEALSVLRDSGRWTPA